MFAWLYFVLFISVSVTGLSPKTPSPALDNSDRKIRGSRSEDLGGLQNAEKQL